MTSAEFMEWYARQPDGERYELIDGMIVPRFSKDIPWEMQAERVVHGDLKGEIFGQFREEVRAKSLPCDAFGDGMSVEIDAEGNFEPDAMVRCGDPLDPNDVVVKDPMIVVEVTSPSTSSFDLSVKTRRYFNNAHLRHYLVILANERSISWYRRDEAGTVTVTHHDSGTITLNPPGIAVDLGALFAERRR